MTTKQVQLLLSYLGYDPGVIDGIMGANTRAAIREFQSNAKISADGIPGPVTYASLKKAVTSDDFRSKHITVSMPSTGGTMQSLAVLRTLDAMFFVTALAMPMAVSTRLLRPAPVGICVRPMLRTSFKIGAVCPMVRSLKLVGVWSGRRVQHCLVPMEQVMLRS